MKRAFTHSLARAEMAVSYDNIQKVTSNFSASDLGLLKNGKYTSSYLKPALTNSEYKILTSTKLILF